MANEFLEIALADLLAINYLLVIIQLYFERCIIGLACYLPNVFLVINHTFFFVEELFYWRNFSTVFASIILLTFARSCLNFSKLEVKGCLLESLNVLMRLIASLHTSLKQGQLHFFVINFLKCHRER